MYLLRKENTSITICYQLKDGAQGTRDSGTTAREWRVLSAVTS